MDLRRLVVQVMVACCVTVFVKWLIVAFFSGWVPDYSVFYAAARMVRIAPEHVFSDGYMTVYQMWLVKPVTGWRPWAYPPTALLPLLPFSFLPFLWSYFAWTGVTLAAFVAATRSLGSSWPKVALILISSPVFFTIRSGQMTLLIGGLIIAAIVMLPKRPLLAGVLIGIAAAIKPQLLAMAPLALIAARRWDALASATAAGVAMVLASLTLGPFLWLDWLESMPRFIATVSSMNLWSRGVTPTAVMWNLGIEGPLQIIVSAAFVAFALVVVWNVFREQSGAFTQVIALVGGALLCVPYAIHYELTILMPAAVALMFRKDSSLILITAAGAMLCFDEFYAPPVGLAFIILALKGHFSMTPLKSGIDWIHGKRLEITSRS